MPHTSSRSSESGCSLLEVLVATSLLVTLLVGVVQVVDGAARAGRRANAITHATVLAQDKLEELAASVATGSVVLQSPAGVLTSNVSGWSDRVDGFVRRWSVEPAPAAAAGLVAIQVLVLPASDQRSFDARPPGRAVLPNQAHLAVARRRPVI